MDESGDRSFPCTKMSPGFDNWRQEVHDNSLRGCLLPPYRNRSPSPDRKFNIGRGSNNTSGYHFGGNLLPGASHPYPYAYNGDRCSRISVGFSNAAVTGKKDFLKVGMASSSNIPAFKPPEFGYGGAQSNVGNNSSIPSQGQLNGTRHDPRLNVKYSKPQVLASLEPEKSVGLTTTLSVGEKLDEEPAQDKENAETQGLPDIVAEVDESLTSDEVKAIRSFKFVLAEHIKDLLNPYWKQGNLSRDAYKIIAKKAVDKVIGSFEAAKFPKTKSETFKYLSASKTKLIELVEGYVKKYQKG